MVILGVFDNLPGAGTYQARLIENYEDMEDALRPYYGEDAEELGDLIQDHLVIAVEILNAAKSADAAGLEDAPGRVGESKLDGIRCESGTRYPSRSWSSARTSSRRPY